MDLILFAESHVLVLLPSLCMVWFHSTDIRNRFVYICRIVRPRTFISDVNILMLGRVGNGNLISDNPLWREPHSWVTTLDVGPLCTWGTVSKNIVLVISISLLKRNSDCRGDVSGVPNSPCSQNHELRSSVWLCVLRLAGDHIYPKPWSATLESAKTYYPPASPLTQTVGWFRDYRTEEEEDLQVRFRRRAQGGAV